MKEEKVISPLVRARRPALIPLQKWKSNEIIINETPSQDLVSRKAIRARIYELQAVLEKATKTKQLPEVEEKLAHYFTDSTYARELFIPASTVMVSHLHKFPRVCIISKGDVSFTTEYGTKRVRAPYTAVFPPGSKVALFTHTDTVWTAIVNTTMLPEKDRTNVSKIKEAILAENHEAYDSFCLENNLKVGEESCLLDL